MLHALVTGASGGIGKAIAYQLAGKSHNLILVARSEDKLKNIAWDLKQKFGISVLYYTLDLSIADADLQLFEFVKQNGIEINILVNNAGYGLSGEILKTKQTDWINMLELNILALFKITYTFLPMLKLQERSYILNVASIAAYQAIPFLSLYSASKSFVLSFSRGLAVELEGTSVSVTCISPGPTDTNFIIRAKIGKRGHRTAEMLNMTPDKVAEIALEAMFKMKKEIIPGVVNKLGAFFSWLLPAYFVEKISAKLYQ